MYQQSYAQPAYNARPPSAAPSHYSNHDSRHGSRPSYGYAQGPSNAPPGADPQLWQYFSAVDRDHSGSISVNELQAALVNGM